MTIVAIIDILHGGTLYRGRFVFAGLDDFLATISINFKSLFRNDKLFRVQPAFNTHSNNRISERETLHSPAEKAKTQVILEEGYLLLFFEQRQLY